jgi:glutamyl-Q tRNA(Asp) synthetase
VDDAEQGITDIVRGADLLESTPRQIFLQRLLRLPTPRYVHLPVAVNARGEKLSKQTHAQPIERARASATVAQALEFLGHEPPRGLERASVQDIWSWAREHWRLHRVPRARSRTCDPAR